MTGPGDLPMPAAVCDGGDLDCGSGLLLIIRTAMQPLAAGEALLVKSRELSVREDLPAWCRMVGHSVLDARAAEAGYWHFLLRKKGDDGALQNDLQQARDHVWQTRVRWRNGLLSQATVRNHGFAIGQPASFDTGDPAPSAIEYLLAAVGGALGNGLQWRLSQQQVEVQALEVVVRGRLHDPMVFLGLADGPAGLRSVEITAYVAAAADDDVITQLWQQTLARCPVTTSLSAATTVQATLRLS